MPKNDSVGTPLTLLNKIRKHFFGYNTFFDPTPLNPQFDKSKDIDGLQIAWADCTYLNPPYSRSSVFLRYAHKQYLAYGIKIVCLVKLDALGTKTFQKMAKDCSIYLLDKRVRFAGYSSVAIFYSVLIVFGCKREGQFKIFYT
jgi:hypothetical protein